MDITTLGYNGVFDVSAPLLNRLLAAHTYDLALRKGDMLAHPANLIGPIRTPDGEYRLCFLLGRMEVATLGDGGGDQVDLFIPFHGISIYQMVNGALRRLTTAGINLGMGISGLRVSSVNGELVINMDAVGPENIRFFLIELTPATDGVGAVTSKLGDALDDAAVDGFLAGKDIELRSADVRTLVAGFIRGGTIAPPRIPLALGRSVQLLSDWSVAADGNGGLDVLFYAPQQDLGDVAVAASIIPPSPGETVFRSSFSISAEVLLSELGSMLRKDWYEQGDGVNTPENPFGSMEVPHAAATMYALPSGRQATVNPPVNAVVELIVPSGGFPASSRVEIRNLDDGSLVRLTASSAGALTAKISAHAGDHLAIAILARSFNKPDLVIWKPRIELGNGFLRVSTHVYAEDVGDTVLDADVDATLLVYLEPDLNTPFGVKVARWEWYHLETPWWLGVAASIFGGPLGTILVQSLETEITGYIANLFGVGGQVSDTLKSVITPLNDQLQAFAAAPHLTGQIALFLDELTIDVNGLRISGWADSGQFQGRGRGILTNMPGAIDIAVDNGFCQIGWQPMPGGYLIQFSQRHAVLENTGLSLTGRSAFWPAILDEIPSIASFSFGVVPINVGESKAFWVDLGDAFAKVLFEWKLVSEGPPVPVCTWIAYQPRRSRSASLAPDIVPVLISQTHNLVFDVSTFRYTGKLDLVLSHFFLTEDTLQAGTEKWTWDDAEVGAAGLLIPGGGVHIEVVDGRRRLAFELDETTLPPGTITPILHTIHFEGTDVFGHKVDVKKIIQTPRQRFSMNRIAEVDHLGRIENLLGPWINPVRGDRDRLRTEELLNSLLQARLGDLGTSKALVRAALDTLDGSRATLDENTAKAVIRLIDTATTGILAGVVRTMRVS